MEHETIEAAGAPAEGFNLSYMELLTGPLSALALAVIMIYTIGRWLAKFVPTVVAKYMEQTDKTIEQLDRLNTAIQEHTAQSLARTDQIIEKQRSTTAGIHSRLNNIEPQIIEIRAAVVKPSKED
jgi:uncharacterized protein YoxC